MVGEVRGGGVNGGFRPKPGEPEAALAGQVADEDSKESFNTLWKEGGGDRGGMWWWLWRATM